MNGFIFLSVISAVFTVVFYSYIRWRRKDRAGSRVPGPVGLVLGFGAFMLIDIVLSLLNNIWFVSLVPLILFIFVLIIAIVSLSTAKYPKVFTRTFSESLLASVAFFIILSMASQILLAEFALINGSQDAEIAEYLQSIGSEYTLEEYKLGLSQTFETVAWAAAISVAIVGVLGVLMIIGSDNILKTEGVFKVRDLCYGASIVVASVLIFLVGSAKIGQWLAIGITCGLIALTVLTFIKPLKFMNKQILQIKD